MADVQIQYIPRVKRTPEEKEIARREQQRKYREKHREELNAKSKQYYDEHRELENHKSKLRQRAKREQAKKESESSGSD